MTSPFILRKGVSRLADLADGISAIDMIVAAGGKWYYCDPANGTSGGDGLTPATANSSLLTVYSKCRSGYNDGVFFIGNGTSYDPAANFTWSNSYCHLIGLNDGLPGMGARCRIVNTAANDLTALFTMSGSGNLVANVKFSDEKDAAADGVCVLVSGDRNHFVNCFFAGMADGTASGPFSRAGSYSLKVSGSENCFDDCAIGLDTIARTAANSELIVSGVRNSFRNCFIHSQSTTSGKFLVKIDNSGGDLRWQLFEDCVFFNYTENWATGITDAFDMPASGATHYVILKGDCLFVGTGTGLADTVTHIYGAGAAPNAGMFLATNPTT